MDVGMTGIVDHNKRRTKTLECGTIRQLQRRSKSETGPRRGCHIHVFPEAASEGSYTEL